MLNVFRVQFHWFDYQNVSSLTKCEHYFESYVKTNEEISYLTNRKLN